MVWSNPLDNSISIALSKLFEDMSRIVKNIFISISAFGDNGIFYILVGILLMFFVKSRKIGLTLIVAAIMTLLFNDMIFKHMFNRLRPFQDPELSSQLIAFVNNGNKVYGIEPSSSSFPSGHTFTAFCAFGGIISLFSFDKTNRKTYLPTMIFFGIFAVLMGFSRILLSHHYFTDVLCGAILGVIFGLSIYLVNKYLIRFGNFIKVRVFKKPTYIEK